MHLPIVSRDWGHKVHKRNKAVTRLHLLKNFRYPGEKSEFILKIDNTIRLYFRNIIMLEQHKNELQKR